MRRITEVGHRPWRPDEPRLGRGEHLAKSYQTYELLDEQDQYIRGRLERAMAGEDPEAARQAAEELLAFGSGRVRAGFLAKHLSRRELRRSLIASDDPADAALVKSRAARTPRERELERAAADLDRFAAAQR